MQWFAMVAPDKLLQSRWKFRFSPTQPEVVYRLRQPHIPTVADGLHHKRSL